MERFNLPKLVTPPSGDCACDSGWPVFNLHPLLPWLFLALVLSFGSGCSSPLLTKKDYRESVVALKDGLPASALRHFPRGEQGSFITTMEQAYLNLLQGKPEIDALQRYSNMIEQRVRYDVSREAASFFYIKTPEDYYASEHEIIWMHMLLSWGYSLRKEYDKGCVETRKAAHLLSYTWSDEGHFDDPALRLFLASLWALCGDWRSAQVDLRAAWHLDNSLTWAKALGDQDSPPDNLIIVLGGVGPEPNWNPEAGLNIVRSARKIDFHFHGQRSALSIQDSAGLKIHSQLSPGAAPWYQRHLVRDNAIHELIADSHYGANFLMEGSLATGKGLAYTAAGIGIAVGGTALGGLVLYLGAEGNSSDLIELGLVIITASVLKGIDVASSGIEESKQRFKQQVDPSENYRFVRFLPDYLWLAWNDGPLSFPLSLKAGRLSKRVASEQRQGKPSVTITHLHDTPRRQTRRPWR